MKKIILLFLTMTLLAGCAQRIGDFTIVSTKNYESSRKYKLVGRYEGSDGVFFFIFPWGTPNIKNAVDRAIEAAQGGVYLTNAVLEATQGPFTIGYRVVGDVYALVTIGDLNNPNLELFDLKEDNGKLVLQNDKHTIEVK